MIKFAGSPCKLLRMGKCEKSAKSRDAAVFCVEAQKYRDRGVVVLAASMDDESTRQYISRYARVFKMEFPILVDASSDTMHELGLGDGIPSTVFFDSDGNVVGRILGQAQKKDVFRRIEWLLGNHDGRRPQEVSDNLGHK